MARPLLISGHRNTEHTEMKMTNLTNTANNADESLIASVLASMPTAADLLEAVAALATAALLTFSLNLML